MPVFIRLVILVLMLSMTGRVWAQEGSESKKALDAVYVNFNYLGTAAAILGSYEFYASEKRNSLFMLRATTGYFGSLYDEGFTFIFNGQSLWGKQKNHFELDYGAAVLWDIYDSEVYPLPILNLGYRYQDFSKSGFVFRVGVGTEFGGYLSFGGSF